MLGFLPVAAEAQRKPTPGLKHNNSILETSFERHRESIHTDTSPTEYMSLSDVDPNQVLLLRRTRIPVCGSRYRIALTVDAAPGLGQVVHVHLLLAGWICITIMGADTVRPRLVRHRRTFTEARECVTRTRHHRTEWIRVRVRPRDAHVGGQTQGSSQFLDASITVHSLYPI